MTVKELIELNPLIADIEIDLRDENGILIQKLEIGARAEEPRNAQLQEITTVIHEEININDEGDFCIGINFKKIPKEWLNLVVDSWRAWLITGESGKQLQTIWMHCHREGYKKEPERPKTDKTKDDGQLSLFGN